MGLDITLLAVDWAHLRAIPADARTAWLEDAAWPDDQWPPPEKYQPGWTWPEGPGKRHRARYDFTMSSYKPHFWAGRRWDDVRDAAHPELRAALDTYLIALVWEGPDGDVRHDGPVFPGDPWYAEPLAVCRPADLPAVAAAWKRAAPLLDTLRVPYAEHAEDPDGWIRDFDEFVAFVQEWSVPVEEATRRPGRNKGASGVWWVAGRSMYRSGTTSLTLHDEGLGQPVAGVPAPVADAHPPLVGGRSAGERRCAR